MKVVFTGPESSGKTSLALWLCDGFDYHYVPEVARAYLEMVELPYHAGHVREIGYLQAWEERIAAQNFSHLCCDTDLLTILIWQKEKYGQYDIDFFERWCESQTDIYFLCMPDIPWQEDPLRENPNDRNRLYLMYEKMLRDNNKLFFEVSGSEVNRKESISVYLRKNKLEKNNHRT